MFGYYLFLIAIVCLGAPVSLQGYPKQEKVFYALQAAQSSPRLKEPTVAAVSREKREDGSESNVTRINGGAAFHKLVIHQSMVRPVVIKVIADSSSVSHKVKVPFQEVADQYQGHVSFLSMNMFGRGSENSSIIANLLLRRGIKKIDLPLFLFFKGGRLFLPIHQGFYTKENMVKLIELRFFRKNAQVSSQVKSTVQNQITLEPAQVAAGPLNSVDQKLDLTVTSTAG